MCCGVYCELYSTLFPIRFTFNHQFSFSWHCGVYQVKGFMDLCNDYVCSSDLNGYCTLNFSFLVSHIISQSSAMFLLLFFISSLFRVNVSRIFKCLPAPKRFVSVFAWIIWLFISLCLICNVYMFCSMCPRSCWTQLLASPTTSPFPCTLSCLLYLLWNCGNFTFSFSGTLDVFQSLYKWLTF